MATSRQNILVIMPSNQFDEDELFGALNAFESAGLRTVVLSKSGKEAVGMKRQRYQPHGIIIDWDKQKGISAKYDAAVLIGGKGAEKSLWDDPIIPQILTDHYRAGKIIGALGSAQVVLARASFLTDESAAPENDKALQELESSGVTCVDEPVVENGRIITGSGGSAAEDFAGRVIKLLKEN